MTHDGFPPGSVHTRYETPGDPELGAGQRDKTNQFAPAAGDDLAAKIQYLINWLKQLGELDDHCFTFPDGDTWYAAGHEPVPEGGATGHSEHAQPPATPDAWVGSLSGRGIYDDEVADGHGSVAIKCGATDCDLHAIRPGKFQCSGSAHCHDPSIWDTDEDR